MLGFKKLLAKGAPADLPEEVRSGLAAWRESPPPNCDELHFHVRYVVVDIVASGLDPERDRLLGIAAACVERGAIVPDAAIFIDLAAAADAAAAARQLLALLQFMARAPLVTYHVPYVGGFLKRVFRERLGLDFEPPWVDLAWLLPSLFEDKSHTLLPLDQWLELFGLAGSGIRRDAMSNTLLIGRVFQMLLVRAVGKQIDTASRLLDESRASSFLRRTH